MAPSQTGSFFNDLRVRANEVRAGANAADANRGQVTGSEGVYDFTRGQYVGEPVEQRELGVPTSTNAIERQVGTPVGSGNAPTSYSRRLAGDYTGYNGPYPSSTTFFAPTYVSDPFLSGRRNIKAGPVNIGFGINASVEYNDNVTRSSGLTAAQSTSASSAPLGTPAANVLTGTVGPKLDDFIASTYLNIDANYQISQYNRLTLTTALGINHYFNHPEVSSNGKEFDVQVLPGSSLAFDLKVGDVVFVLYDRISVRPASQDNFALDNRDIFGVFQNDAGIAMNWAVNSKVNFSLDFNRSDSNSLQDIYKIYDRNITSLAASLAWTPNGSYTVGIEGTYSWVNYKENFNNDGRNGSAGVFLVWPITRNTLLKASVGVQSFQFDSPPSFNRSVTDKDLLTTQNDITSVTNQIATVSKLPVDQQSTTLAQLQNELTRLQNQLSSQTIQKQKEDVTAASHTFDSSTDQTDYYYNVTLSNQLNARLTHQISFGHETSLNTTSNFITADYVSYGMGIIAWRGARVTLSGYFENAKESGGRLKEDLKQYGFDVLLTHRLSDHLTAGVGYHFGNTDSDLPNRDYQQHAFTVDLSYALTSKWNVGVGYRYWKTNADDPTQSFTQNRVIISTNYNF